MIGDSEYAGRQQQGVREAGRGSSGAHLAKKSAPSNPKKIKALSSSYQGRIVALFEDGTSQEIQRGDYPIAEPPKVGEFWPRLALSDIATPAELKEALKGAIEAV